MYRAIAALLALCATLAAGAAELVRVTAREGATDSYLLYPAASPTPGWVVMLFPGSTGLLNLTEAGPQALQGNFLIRTLSFWDTRGAAVAVVDAPSDKPQGMVDRFRRSDLHATDVAAITADLHQRFPAAKIALVGTSRGSISVGALLARSPQLADAYVMTSPVTEARPRNPELWPGLSGLEFAAGPARVLVVSHRQDGCTESPFAGAQKLAAGGYFAFTAVQGGGTPKSDPCEALSKHGYIGQEKAVLTAIANWLDGTAAPADVE